MKSVGWIYIYIQEKENNNPKVFGLYGADPPGLLGMESPIIIYEDPFKRAVVQVASLRLGNQQQQIAFENVCLLNVYSSFSFACPRQFSFFWPENPP